MVPSPPANAQHVIDRCRSLGFALAGVCEARDSEYPDQFRNWIAERRHGEMAYLARNVEARLSPSVLMPGASSIIVVADQYAARGDSKGGVAAATESNPDAVVGRIARYAQGDDYHEVMKSRLHTLCDELRSAHPDEQFRAFVDTAPVLEREHAVRAGLGWIGRNSLLIHPRLGSWLFLGGVLTSLRLHADAAPMPVPDHCGSCTRCIDACPTGAIAPSDGPRSVDGSRCISGLTIEQRGPIDPGFHRMIGDWFYGCDVCQEVCPHNSRRDPSVDVGTPHPDYTPRRSGFDMLQVLGWTELDRRTAFRNSAMKRAKLGMLHRNAAIVVGNSRHATPDGDHSRTDGASG